MLSVECLGGFFSLGDAHHAIPLGVRLPYCAIAQGLVIAQGSLWAHVSVVHE